MRAVVQYRYGGPEVLELADVAPPTIKRDDEVIIRVRAAGVNMADWHLMTGTPTMVRLALGRKAPRQPIRGIDVAGVVEAVGPGVTRFAVGDEVFGSAEGTFAELARTTEKRIALKPTGIPFPTAGAVPMAGLTALTAVRAANIAPGDEVLVTGAGGGVGSLAVQLATARGARVTGVCSSAKHDLVRSCGAVRVIDYAVQDVTERDDRYDAIIDVAGRRPLSAMRRILTSTGIHILVGGEGGNAVTGGYERNLGAAIRSVFSRRKARGILAGERPADLEELSGMLVNGVLRPIVERQYPLEEVAAAMDHLATGRALGKLVVVP